MREQVSYQHIAPLKKYDISEVCLGFRVKTNRRNLQIRVTVRPPKFNQDAGSELAKCIAALFKQGFCPTRFTIY